jgi:4-hydroxy-tetrahydrodipicolinate reductase
MKILLSGYNGAMGKIVRELFAQYPQHDITIGVDQKDDPSAVIPVVASILSVATPVDVVIDFSHPSLLPDLISFGIKTKTPLVICTTGLDEEALERLRVAAEVIPVFHSGNMSFGIHILQDILKTYSQLLYPSYDIELIEKHHRRKVDAPSGTALMLAHSIQSSLDDNLILKHGRVGKEAKRDPVEIGIHAIRGGTIVGEHAVLFAGEDEVLEFKHVALSRRLFATGAYKASEFIVQMSPGLYNMTDVIHYFK